MVLLEVSLMSFILRISKEIKWKDKMVSHEVLLMILVLPISKEIKWEVKVVLLEVSLMKLHSSDIQVYQTECESGVTRSVIENLHASVIQ